MRVWETGHFKKKKRNYALDTILHAPSPISFQPFHFPVGAVLG